MEEGEPQLEKLHLGEEGEEELESPNSDEIIIMVR